MNIFVLDRYPHRAAQMMCDIHVSKMTLESAQMICTVAHSFGVDAPYKPTHQNHPCVRWLREDDRHLTWLLLHFRELRREYALRFGREHLSSTKVWPLAKTILYRLCYSDNEQPTGFILAMPPQYADPAQPVESYRRYYWFEKQGIARWRRGRPAPYWWTPEYFRKEAASA